MSLEIRAITSAEVNAFRRAVRAAFGNAETVDDTEWALAAHEPLDRTLGVHDGESIVATLRSFPTELTVPGGVVPAGALTSVSCRATHRRQGLLTQMIVSDLAGSRDRDEAADVLIASEYPIYGRFGYGPAVFAVGWELDVRAARFTVPGSGTVEYVDDHAFRKEAPAIFERVRLARPGMIARSELVWDARADLRRRPEDKPWLGFRVLVRDDDGVAQGWANYTIKEDWTGFRARSVAQVPDLCATTPEAEARLWRFLAELDLVTTVKAADRPVDDLLPWLLDDARAAKQTERFDFLWVRLLDVPAVLQGRSYATSARVVLEVTDPLGLAAGRWALEASPDGASCVTTGEFAELTIPVRTLGAVCLGGVRLSTLHAAGWLDEHVPGAVIRADGLLAGPVMPWCNTWF